MSLPSKTPTTIVSASVSAGAVVVVWTCIGRSNLVSKSRPCPRPSSSAPRARPSASSAAACHHRRHRTRGDRDHRGARTRRRRTRGGRPRRHGPGAPGRAGPDPLAPGPDQGRDPEGGLLGDDQQGLRLGPARLGAARPGDPRAATSRSASAAAWSRCRGALPAARRALRLPHGRRQGARRDGPRRADQPVQPASRCSSRRPRSSEELELTRLDLDRWALRSHERALAATDDGRLPEEIVPVTIKGRKGDTVVEVDEGPRRGTTLETLAKLPGWVGKDGSHTAGNSPASTTAAARSCVQRRVGHGQRQGGPGRDRRPRAVGQRLRLPRDDARLGGEKALAKAGVDAADIDLWEINEAFASVTLNSIQAAGHRRGEGQRQRRRHRAGPPGRRVGRAHPRRARARAAPARRRARLAAIC